MAEISGRKGAPEVAPQSPFAPPAGRDGLSPSESHLSLDIEMAAGNGHSDVAYNMFKDAYNQLATKEPQRAASFVKGVESHLLTDHLNNRLAVQWGLERLGANSLDTKITDSDLTSLLSNKKQDPFSRAMGSELRKNLSSINPQSEGGFLGFGSHPAESASKLDLERFIDSKDHRQQTVDMGTNLLYGKNSVFDQVARNAHKNPNDPDQALTLEDFQNFADSKTPRDASTNRLVHQVIDRWALESVNALAKHFDGDAMISKQTIRYALSEMDSTGYYR